MFKPIALIALGAALLAASTPILAAFEVEDDAGQTFRFDAPATRIVSLAPHITELLFAAGAGGRIVAADSYSDYPEAARAGMEHASSSAARLQRNKSPDMVRRG